MMIKIFLVCTVILAASRLSSGVILRPKWYPYFMRENQGQSEGTSNAGQSSSQGESVPARQTRTAEVERVPFCQDGLASEECLDKIVMVVSKILHLNAPRYPPY